MAGLLELSSTFWKVEMAKNAQVRVTSKGRAVVPPSRPLQPKQTSRHPNGCHAVCRQKQAPCQPAATPCVSAACHVACSPTRPCFYKTGGPETKSDGLRLKFPLGRGILRGPGQKEPASKKYDFLQPSFNGALSRKT